MTPCPFCQGYNDATEGTTWDDPTWLEVANAHPEYEPDDITQYINGACDSLRGDAFRMGLHIGGPITPRSVCPLRK